MIDEIRSEDHGLGLKTLKRQLELLYPKKHLLTIKDTNDDFIVQLQLDL